MRTPIGDAKQFTLHFADDQLELDVEYMYGKIQEWYKGRSLKISFREKRTAGYWERTERLHINGKIIRSMAQYK